MKTLEEKFLAILDQISSDIEMLRGSEARILARKGDFLQSLGDELRVLKPKIEKIGVIAAWVKTNAESERDK